MKYSHKRKSTNPFYKVVGIILLLIGSAFLGTYIGLKVIEMKIDQDIQSKPQTRLQAPENPLRTLIKSGISTEQHTNHAKIQVTADNEWVQGGIDE